MVGWRNIAWSWDLFIMKSSICLLFSCPFIVCVVQIQTSMPPGIQAEGSGRWGDLAEKLQGEMSIWLSSQPKFTDQQLTVTAMFGSHSKNAMGDWMFSFFSVHVGFIHLFHEGFRLRFRFFLTYCMSYFLYPVNQSVLRLQVFSRRQRCKKPNLTLKYIANNNIYENLLYLS